jgi:hypothetical protein
MIDEVDLIAVVVDHAGLSRLCADLEAVADRLPLPPDPADAARLREELLHLLPAHDARERAFARHILAPAGGGPAAPAILRQIEKRRAACVVQGQDLAAMIAPEAMPASADMLGYMLRCFFEACRQAMVFEELAILHLARRRLTGDARTLLIRSLTLRCAD